MDGRRALATFLIVFVVLAILFAASRPVMKFRFRAMETERELSRTELIITKMEIWFSGNWFLLPIPGFLAIYALFALLKWPKARVE